MCVQLAGHNKSIFLYFYILFYLYATATATEELQQQAGVFKRNANELKKKMWWKNIKVLFLSHFSLFVIFLKPPTMLNTFIDR